MLNIIVFCHDYDALFINGNIPQASECICISTSVIKRECNISKWLDEEKHPIKNAS